MSTPTHNALSRLEMRELRERAMAALTREAPLKFWYHQCHAASIALVRAGIGSRVARGFCEAVPGQHSWVVVGMDCYRKDVTVIDPTLWSYRKSVSSVYVGPATRYGHTPHGGVGNIWQWGRPVAGGGPVIELTPAVPLSSDARLFLEMLGPLDWKGWHALASAPVEGWPAAEIFAAMDDTEELRHGLPIDKVGMLTDRNPGRLYLPGPEKKRRRRGGRDSRVQASGGA